MASTLFASVLWIILTFLRETTSEQGEIQLPRTLRFVGQPRDVIVVRNSALTLDCAVDASAEGGPCNVTWHHNGEAVTDTRLTVLPNGSLHFPKVIHKVRKPRSDEGDYKCFVRNNIGTIFSRTAKVQIATLGHFSGELEDVTVAQGQLVRLSCQIDGLPAPTITWERDRRPLPQDPRYVTLPSGILQISSVRTSDAGTYKCHASNIARSRQSADAQLTIIPTDGSTLPPRLLAGPQDQVVLVGTPALLECSITGLPQRDITWSRFNGASLPQAPRIIVGTGSVQISAVRPSDAGVYVCHSGSIRAPATLQVLEPPKATSTPENLADVTLATVRLYCTFSGTPPLSISWYKDGTPLPNNGRTTLRDNNTVVSIINTDPLDSGFYQCVGRNRAGEDSLIHQLRIFPGEHAPNAPHSLVVQRYTSTSILLSWQPPSTQEIVGYSVHYTRQGEKEIQMVSQSTELQINNLKPHQRYTLYVVAYVSSGASIHSNIITQYTDEDVPKGAPECSLLAVGAASLLATWEPLSANVAGGVVTSYRVYYRLKDQETVQQHEVPGIVTEYTITDLEPAQAYEVRVLAGTKKGFPELSDSIWPWVTRVTSDRQNEGLPGVPEMQVVVLNSTVLRVSWKEPAIVSWKEPAIIGAASGPMDPVIGYKLRFRQPGDSPGTLILVPEERNKTLTMLEPGTWYEISLLAFNTLGDGDMATRNVQTQTGTVPAGSSPPPPPPFIEAEPLNDSTVRVSWQVPATLLPIRYYTIRSSRVDPQYGRQILNLARAKEITSVDTTVIISGLEPFQRYTFAVSTHTDMDGVYSQNVSCLTREGRPGAPRNPSGKVRGPKEVELSWQPPAESNGIILTYVIFYSADNSSPDVHWMKKQENGSATHAIVHNLHEDEMYFFKLRAATSAGEGPPTNIIKIQTKQGGVVLSDRDMGIVVGVGIGGTCIIICALVIFLRNRCFPPRPSPPVIRPGYHGNGCVVNGNGLNHCPPQLLNHCVHELESLAPMLTHIPENENSDTKGGTYIRFNGGLNGYVVNGVPNARMPNGKCKSYILRDHSFPDGSEDCPQMPLRAYSLHNQTLSGEPITVQLSSLEDIEGSYRIEYTDHAMKASPSSSGVTDCTQGAGDTGGPSSNTSSQNASLERHGHNSVPRSATGSYKGRSNSKGRYGNKTGRAQTSPHSTLSSCSASSGSSTPMGEAAPEGGVPWASLHTHPHQHQHQPGPLRKDAVGRSHPHAHPAVHPQDPSGVSLLTHISSQGHGPGRPVAYPLCMLPGDLQRLAGPPPRDAPRQPAPGHLGYPQNDGQYPPQSASPNSTTSTSRNHAVRESSA